MQQKMSYSQVATNISKYDSFLSSQVSNPHKKSSNKDPPQTENEQKEIRKAPVKKISFKVKKNPSFCRRRTDISKNAVVSSHVAQLTQKFNNLIVEKDQAITKPVNPSQINKKSDPSPKYNTLPTRVNIAANKNLTTKENTNNRSQRDFVRSMLSSQTNEKSNDTVQLRRQIATDDCDEVTQNNRNNSVKEAINIFENRASLCDNRGSVQTINSNVNLNRIKSNTIGRVQNKVTINNNDVFNEMCSFKNEINKNKDDLNSSNEEPKLEINSFRPKSEDRCSPESNSSSLHTLDLHITPNNSFLWRDKCSPNSVSKSITNDEHYSLLNAHSKSDSSVNAQNNSEYEQCDVLDCNERIYEKLDTPEEENIYEIMSSDQYRPSEETPSVNTNAIIDASDAETSISNCYESIYSKDYKTITADGECIYESVYERTQSRSNRDSLVSCEQNSNSLYGKALWESEDDASIYKPVSDLSDDWVDITDNEENHNNKAGVLIKYEKRSKKSTWSQHLRDQWAKTYSPVSVTVDVESDPDHHYESLYSEKDHDDDYDSFESDTCSEHSFKSDEEYYVQSTLPKPPNSQPYGLIKFAGKHMKKLKRRSIDLSKSLSRMTKRMSRTDISTLNMDKLEKQPVEPKTNEYTIRESPKNQLSRSHIAKNSVIYENLDLTQKSGGDQEKERLSLLKRIRRSMSLSAESASELTTHLTSGKPRSTFYLTEVIDIDKEENDNVSESPKEVAKVLKSNIIRPKSPPPEIPVKNKGSKESVVDNTVDINENKSRTCWYTEIDLYEGSESTPSTSTAENSGSGTSNIDINHDSEDYYNMLNDRHSNDIKSDSDNEKSNLEDTLTCTTPDIQLLLQDEPLYQFYDAAVLESIWQDGTTQFDTDNYEEVDDYSEVSSYSGSLHDDVALPKKSVIPFTKTLWCEIPEVIQSSVLSKLSVRQKKLQEAKFEIITSEASYVNSLNVLHDHFALSLKDCDFINEKEWEIMFGKVESVKACSQRLLQELERCWQDNILLYRICDVIQQQAEENFNVFIPYCENQILLGGTFSQLMERPGFVNYLRDLESSSSCQSLTLYSFLMLPMQRITRWPLLVDAMLKRLSQSDPEYVVCQHALATLNKIVSQCNEAARKKEREIELQAIADKLEFPKGVVPIDIVSQDRWLVRSGNVMSIQQKSEDSKMTFGRRFSKIQLLLYLFNDMFFVTKEKSNEIYTILHYCPRNLVELRDADMLLPKKEGYEKNLLFLTILENQEGKTIELVLSCTKESDKERWIEAISPPKSEDPEETLYECWDCPQVIASHNYVSVQPDELSLSRGDTINVLRKMADGWYHGERIRDGQTGWFPSNYTNEIMNPHVRARNLKQRYRLLAFSENYLKSS